MEWEEKDIQTSFDILEEIEDRIFNE